MSLFTILLGGDLVATSRVKQQIKDSYIIAADSGIEHCNALNVKPKLWIGDFDSCGDQAKKDYSDLEVIEHSCNKDKSDGELAVDVALQGGAKKIIFCGAFGGKRLDHSVAHIAMGLKLATQNIEVLLTSGVNEAIGLVEKTRLKPDWEPNTCFSIVGFSDLEGLIIHGAKWPLEGKVNIPLGSTHTLSNIVERELQIEISSGRAIVLAKIG